MQSWKDHSSAAVVLQKNFPRFEIHFKDFQSNIWPVTFSSTRLNCKTILDSSCHLRQHQISLFDLKTFKALRSYQFLIDSFHWLIYDFNPIFSYYLMYLTSKSNWILKWKKKLQIVKQRDRKNMLYDCTNSDLREIFRFFFPSEMKSSDENWWLNQSIFLTIIAVFWRIHAASVQTIKISYVLKMNWKKAKEKWSVKINLWIKKKRTWRMKKDECRF